jgi:ACS family tartrate transporter-like MFS transporter
MFILSGLFIIGLITLLSLKLTDASDENISKEVEVNINR